IHTHVNTCPSACPSTTTVRQPTQLFRPSIPHRSPLSRHVTNPPSPAQRERGQGVRARRRRCNDLANNHPPEPTTNALLGRETTARFKHSRTLTRRLPLA